MLSQSSAAAASLQRASPMMHSANRWPCDQRNRRDERPPSHEGAQRSGAARPRLARWGREVIAVWEDLQAVKPSYLMWLEWTDGRISFIEDAELVLAPDTAPPGEPKQRALRAGRRRATLRDRVLAAHVRTRREET
jgi:hypothetical protein